VLQEDDKMKIGYRKKWKDDAVSPVIATILMVAITVVLAAVLYLMVSIFILEPEVTPNVTLGNGAPTKNQGEWTVSVVSVDHKKDLSQYKIAILNGTAVALESTPLETIKDTGVTANGLSLRYYEPNGDNKMNAGDYFIVSGTDNDSQYTIEVYFSDQGKVSGNTGKIR
jgi:flagellin-like protein